MQFYKYVDMKNLAICLESFCGFEEGKVYKTYEVANRKKHCYIVVELDEQTHMPFESNDATFCFIINATDEMAEKITGGKLI